MAVRQTIRRKPGRKPKARHVVRALKKPVIELFDVVRIMKPLQGFEVGTKAAVVDVMIVPKRAYHLEVVLDTGKTAGLIFGVIPKDIELVLKADGSKP